MKALLKSAAIAVMAIGLTASAAMADKIDRKSVV